MKLKFLPWEQLPKLTEILRLKWPRTSPTIYTMECYRRWRQMDPTLKAYLLTPNGEIDKYGSCCMVVPDHENNVLIESISQEFGPIEDLARATVRCTCIDWTRLVMLGPIFRRFGNVIDVFLDEGLTRVHSDIEDLVYQMHRKDALNLKLECPDVRLGALHPDLAERINAEWRFSDGPGTLPMIRGIICVNGGIVVYPKNADEPVAWVAHAQQGGPGLFHTTKAHRNKGYGTIALAAATKMIATKDYHPVAYVIRDNIASATAFKKLGYSYCEDARWCWLTRRKPNPPR